MPRKYSWECNARLKFCILCAKHTLDSFPTLGEIWGTPWLHELNLRDQQLGSPNFQVAFCDFATCKNPTVWSKVILLSWMWGEGGHNEIGYLNLGKSPYGIEFFFFCVCGFTASKGLESVLLITLSF